MIHMLRLALLTLLAGAVAACQTAPSADLPSGAAAYEIMPAFDAAAPPTTYRIGANDILSVRVFQEPELSAEEVPVDEVGSINLPLIGEILAAGKTAGELSREIEGRLGERYLRQPQVVVAVATAAKRLVTVDGQVKMPGVYEIDRNYTLLSAIARAQSTLPTAELDEIVIFRSLNGQRVGAIFNLDDIRKGRAPDPQVLSGDVVVVGFSSLKGVFRDILAAAPLFNVFRPY